MILMPGLVNAHTHVSMSIFRGVSDDKPLQQWLEEDIFPLEEEMSREDVKRGARLGIEEMIRTGTTCFNDMYAPEDAVAEAVEEKGIRAVLSNGMIDLGGGTETEIEESREFIEHRSNSRIETGVAPHSTYTCSKELLDLARKQVEETGSIIHTHISENESENQEVLEKKGLRPLEAFERSFSGNRTSVLAHCTKLDSDEIQQISETDWIVAHNPSANLKLGSGIAPVPEMMNAGASVALGTDGPASNNGLNMFEEMNTMALIHKRDDPSSLNAQQVLDSATIEGGKISERKIGRIKEGFRADVLAIDSSHPSLQPLEPERIVSHLVYSFPGEVKATWVDGELLFDRGGF
jgi:5-methylthioadenosine/S-adenosylhomocysteine deaminase